MYGTDYPEVMDPGPEGNPTDVYAAADKMFGGQLRMAHRLAAGHGHRLMFVHSVGWHYWTGTHWAEDDRGHADRAVVEVLRSALSDSYGDQKLRSDVAKCETANGFAGVLKLAESLEVFATTVSDLDSDPWLLNCANGTLDLRSRTVRPHDPADRITKVCRGAYKPGARSEEWDAFLAKVLPDEAERAYLQRVVGQALLGKVEEHLFPILTGTGANGKGTAYGAIGHAVGAYGIVVDPELLMVKDYGGGGTTEMLDLRGARIAFASETGERRKLDEALMKRLAGGDKLRGRRLYRNPVEWEPTHQLIYITNHLPTVKGDDPATWRRIQVIPFDVTIPEAERDGTLGDRLQLAADEILAWAVEGYFDYRDNGMQTPESVRAATEAYQVQSDAVRRFVEEACMTSPAAATRTSELYAAWQKWAQSEDVEPMSDKAFGKELDRLGFPAKKTKYGAMRAGITDLETGDDDAQQSGW
jgi:putative DNA primase/helicase